MPGPPAVPLAVRAPSTATSDFVPTPLDPCLLVTRPLDTRVGYPAPHRPRDERCAEKSYVIIIFKPVEFFLRGTRSVAAAT